MSVQKNKTQYENIADALEVYLEWIFMYKDKPLSEIAELHTAEMLDMLEQVGGRVRKGDIHIRVFVDPGPGLVNHLPWGIAEAARQKRNERIVELRDGGLTFPDICARVGLTESGTRTAYEKEKARQNINGGQND
jgi:hypothetical protein